MVDGQVFRYIVLGCVAAILVGVTLFVWRVNRRAEAGNPDEHGR
jgi:hypothetical protein